MRVARWLALGATAAGGAALLVLAPPAWIAAAETGAAAAGPWLGAVRIAGIVALWRWWHAVVDRLPGLGPAGVAYLKARRAFWIGVLAAVELVLVRNVPGALWAFVE